MFSVRTFLQLLVLLAVSCSGFSDTQALPPTASVLVLNPSRVDFGNQTVGSQSEPVTVEVHNAASTTLSIRDITASGIDFSETNDCPGTLAASAGCSIKVAFKPAITGPRIGTVIISTSDPQSPHMLILNGTGQ